MALVPFPSKGAKSASERDPDDDWDDDDAAEESGGKMSFLDHLDELRRRIMWALGSVVVGFGIAIAFYQRLFDFVIGPMQAMLPKGQTLIFTEPTEAMMIYIKIAVIAGILIASPAVMTQVWLFVAPGLYSHEKKMAIPFILVSSLFFIGGAAFAHYYVFPLTFKFFSSFSSDAITFMPRIEPAFGLYMKLILIFGAIFQMPTVVALLSRLGLITRALHAGGTSSTRCSPSSSSAPCSRPALTPWVRSRWPDRWWCSTCSASGSRGSSAKSASPPRRSSRPSGKGGRDSTDCSPPCRRRTPRSVKPRSPGYGCPAHARFLILPRSWAPPGRHARARPRCRRSTASMTPA